LQQAEAEAIETPGTPQFQLCHLADTVLASDIILHVLDARDPLGSRSLEMERGILKEADRRIILVLNNVDQVSGDNVKLWSDFLQAEHPTIPLVQMLQKGATKGNQSPTANILLKLVDFYAESNKLDTAPTVGVIGYAHVGAEKVIEALQGKFVHVCKMEEEIEQMQSACPDAKIRLLGEAAVIADTNATWGMLPSVICNVVPDPVVALQSLYDRCEPLLLMKAFQIPRFTDLAEFTEHANKKYPALSRRGLRKNGDANNATGILSSLKSGQVPFCTEPPLKYTADVQHSWGADQQKVTALANPKKNIFKGLSKTSTCLVIKGEFHDYQGEGMDFEDPFGLEEMNESGEEDEEMGESESDGENSQDAGNDDDEEEEEEEEEKPVSRKKVTRKKQKASGDEESADSYNFASDFAY